MEGFVTLLFTVGGAGRCMYMKMYLSYRDFYVSFTLGLTEILSLLQIFPPLIHV